MISPTEFGLEPFVDYPPNRHAPAVLEYLRGWAGQQGLAEVLGERGDLELEKFVKVSVDLAALVAPEDSEEELRLIGLVNAGLFTFDAHADGEIMTARAADGRPQRPWQFYNIFRDAGDILAHPEAQADLPNPYARALRSVALHVRSLRDPLNYERWASSYKAYLKGVTDEMYYRDNAVTPGIETFKAMRREASGSRVVTSLINFSPMALKHPLVGALLEAGIDTLGWYNDVTDRLEVAEGRAQLNLVQVILANKRKRDPGYSLDDAVNEARILIKDREREILDLEELLLRERGVDPTVPPFIKGIRGWLNGYLRFVREHPRYGGEV